MSGSLVIRNRSRYPRDEVRALVKFAVSEIDTRGVCVNVKNARNAAARGRAYSSVPYISDAPPTSVHLITIGIGPPDAFPHERAWEGKVGPPYAMHDWREALVAIAAHEALHIEQFKEGLPLSEVKCERFAVETLRRYREHPDA